MKPKRQACLLNIIENVDVETQEELAQLLRQEGFQVTQATVSRDIKELRLIKVLSPNGIYKYAQVDKGDAQSTSIFMRIFSDSVLSVEASGNIIVIKTLSGSANAAAEAIDTLGWPEILGTIAGDNTIFLVMQESTNLQDAMNKLRRLCK